VHRADTCRVVVQANYEAPAANIRDSEREIEFDIVLEKLVLGVPRDVFVLALVVAIALVLSLWIPQFCPQLFASVVKYHRD